MFINVLGECCPMVLRIAVLMAVVSSGIILNCQGNYLFQNGVVAASARYGWPIVYLQSDPMAIIPSGPPFVWKVEISGQFAPIDSGYFNRKALILDVLCLIVAAISCMPVVSRIQSLTHKKTYSLSSLFEFTLSVSLVLVFLHIGSRSAYWMFSLPYFMGLSTVHYLILPFASLVRDK
jgi:hypothetical protein